MRHGSLNWQSLKVRLTTLTLAVLLVTLWSLSFYSYRILRNDLERVIGNQQYQSAAIVAIEIDQGVKQRLSALDTIARSISSDQLANPDSLQTLLENRPIFQELFNDGIRIIGPDALPLASVPYSRERMVSLDAGDDYLAAALRDGRSTVGRPTIKKGQSAPTIEMATPIRDSFGRIIAAITGSTSLVKASFLDRMITTRSDTRIGFLVISPHDGLFVTATDKSRVFKALPAPGINPMHDRYMSGYEGYGVAVNSRGVEELSAAYRVATTGWFVVSVLPTDEAFAPIHALKWQIWFATVLLSLVACLLTWWITALLLRKRLAPILAAARRLESPSDDQPLPERLPIVCADEIGELVTAFNGLLDTASNRESLLRQKTDALATEHQIAEEYANRLAKVNAHLKTLIESLPDLLWLKDADGIYLACNSRFEQFFGACEADILGRTDYDFVDRELADFFRDHDRKAMAKGSPSVNEEWITFAGDGHRELLETTKAPVYDSQGGLVGVLGIGHDITERNRNETLLQQSAQRFRNLHESMRDAFARVDLAGQIVECNHEFLDLTGYEEAELAGLNYRQITPERWHESEDRILREEVLVSGASQVYEKEYIRKDGSIVPIELRTCLLRDEFGQPVGMWAIIRDISERKRQETLLASHRQHLEALVAERTSELMLAKEVAESGSRAKSTFLANMSHELRTPMNAIMGMTEGVMRRSNDPDIQSRLGKAIQASKHLLAIINDILDISKIEAERMLLDHLPFTLRTVLDDLGVLLREKTNEKGIDLRFEIAPDCSTATLNGDAVRLRQILLNLISNAIKFTESGGRITLRIERLESSSVQAIYRMEVSDTGIGIAENIQPRLFNAFEQADSTTTRKYGGTGLGLAISKRLVKLMGGQIGVRSTLGQGSTFWFTARFDIGAPSTEQDRLAGDAAAELRARYAGTQILLAEDEPINQEVAVDLLTSVGLRVDVADDGQAAVERAREKIYALIILDVQMPVMNGNDAAREIRKLPGYSNVPILAMTANAFSEDRQKCLDAGMNDHIGKPVDPDQMYRILLDWLSGR